MFDTRIGIVSKNYRVDAATLVPDTIRLDSKYENFYFCDHIAFLGQKDSTRYALSTTFGRALADNRFKRAERDFTGFFFDGHAWTALPYTRMRHDSLRLDLNYPCVFGGLSLSESHTEGEVVYSRHNLTFNLKFRDLVPVQSLRNGDIDRRSHAIGSGTLLLANDTITGTVYCELVQMEDYNPFVSSISGLEYVDYDWLALISNSGKRLLASSDSAATGNRILKNFVAFESIGSLRYADGSDNVRIISDGLTSDPKQFPKKNITVPGLGVQADVTLSRKHTTCVGDFCISIVDATLKVEDNSESAWGIIEHRKRIER